AVGILLHVDQHAARWPLRDDAFVGHQIRMLGSHRSRNNFAEGAQLLISIDGLHGDEDVHSGAPGVFRKLAKRNSFNFSLKALANVTTTENSITSDAFQIKNKIYGITKMLIPLEP